MNLVEQFFKLIEEQGCEVFDYKDKAGFAGLDELMKALDAEVSLAPERSKNVRLVRTKTGDQFLYVLESSTAKGFWGPDTNVIIALGKKPEPWALVLLHGNSSMGYWFRSEVVLSRIAQHEWRLGKDGYSYKVNAPKQVTRAEKFITPKKLPGFLSQDSKVR